MQNNEKFLICGGDMRQQKMAYALAEKGYKVCLFGFDELFEHKAFLTLQNNLELALNDATYIVLGLPCVVNGCVNAPLYSGNVTVERLFSLIRPDQRVYCGMLTATTSELAAKYGVCIEDYFTREELNILNAIPTVEGALQIAMEETPFTIHGSKCLVLGYGRIGKMLSAALHKLGANVHVAARTHQDLAWVYANGYEGVWVSDLQGVVGGMDIIFNTIPVHILNYTVLNSIKSDNLIIDLASKPGGVDMDAAKTLGKNVVWALSLPPKVV